VLHQSAAHVVGTVGYAAAAAFRQLGASAEPGLHPAQPAGDVIISIVTGGPTSKVMSNAPLVTGLPLRVRPSLFCTPH
jgi:hypothetical protein